MGGTSIMFVRRSVRNVAVDNDQTWPVSYCLHTLESPFQHFKIISIADTRDVPSVGNKACGNIIAKREISVSFNSYPIAVIDPTKIWQAQVASQRGCLI